MPRRHVGADDVVCRVASFAKGDGLVHASKRERVKGVFPVEASVIKYRQGGSIQPRNPKTGVEYPEIDTCSTMAFPLGSEWSGQEDRMHQVAKKLQLERDVGKNVEATLENQQEKMPHAVDHDIRFTR